MRNGPSPAMQVSHSGYHSAAKFWPGIFAGRSSEDRTHVMKGLSRVRSVLIKGFETMIMVSSLLKHIALHRTYYAFESQELFDKTGLCACICIASACTCTHAFLPYSWQGLMQGLPQARLLLEDPGCEESILADWEGLLARTLREWGLQPAILEAFSNGYRSACFLKDRVRALRRARLVMAPGIVHWARVSAASATTLAFWPCRRSCKHQHALSTPVSMPL